MKKIILLATLFIGTSGYAQENCSQLASPSLVNACLNLNTVVAQSQSNMVATFAAGLQQSRSANSSVPKSVDTPKAAPAYQQPKAVAAPQATVKQSTPSTTTPTQTYRPKINY